MGDLRSFREVVERLRANGPVSEPDEVADARRAEAERLSMLRERLGRARVPERLIRIVEAGVTVTPAVEAVEAWLRGDRTFLFLSGETGGGKSVAGAFSLGLRGGRWIRAVDLVRLGQFEREQIAAIEATHGILVLDDLGAEAGDATGWAASLVVSLLDARYDALARTLVTTNLPGPIFMRRYGAAGRLQRRLREAGSWVAVSAPPAEPG